MALEIKSEYGSFRDSLRAPIHRWFTYPAGYSHKLVESMITTYGLNGDSTIADPFVGTGTTSVAAKMAGVNSIGVEARAFVHWVAKTKMFFHYDLEKLANAIRQTVEQATRLSGEVDCAALWPPLVYKCFTEDNLRQLAALRQAVSDVESESHIRDFLKLALTSTLRVVTPAGAGWGNTWLVGGHHARNP